MATVYLARDVKHDRMVAVKVLRPELSASLGSERFLREIQITAKLSHPHILPLYDSGDADGFLYYVMPFVEGESLADLMVREQQLPIHDAVRITREVAEALSHAHSYGLIHRDIKPQNILLSGGHAVVADFGISRAVSEAGGEKLTQTGMAVGTPAYMAPEQAAGDPNVDGRADIYSLGCVLYEMLVGQIPFTGPTPQAIMARQAMDQVPLPHIVRDTIPDELEDVILTALAKSPADRFRTASEFAEALMTLDSGAVAQRRVSRAAPVRRRPVSRRVVVAASSVAAVGLAVAVWQLWPSASSRSTGALAGGLDPSSVAVLYFDDLSPDGALGYVADGLTEGLIDELRQVRALDVVSRNGVAQFRNHNVSRDSIARALGVGSLIVGSVERAGDRVRVTATLVEGTSGVDYTRTSFELPARELLAALDSVTQRVARLLRERLGEEVRLRELRTETNVDAWALAQQGERARKAAEELITHDDMAGAFQAFQRADSILARAEATDAQWVEPIVLRGQIAYRRSRLAQDAHERVEGIETGVSHVERALGLGPNQPKALELRGTLRYWRWLLHVTPDPAARDDLLRGAQQDLEAAVQADPTLASAYSTLSHLYYQTEDAVSAVLAARRAYEEDAYLSVADLVLRRLFWGSYDLEQHTQATRWCEEGRRRFPEDFRFVKCQLWLMTMDAAEPDVDEAWRLSAEMETLAPEPVTEYYRHEAQMVVGGVIARAGLADSARNVLVRARGNRQIDPTLELAFDEAFMRTLLGDHDEAIDLVKQYLTANPEQDHGFERGGDIYWWWRDLRDHPGFRELAGLAR